MAVREFNCNKIKRTFWPFTLKDKKDEEGNVTEKGKKIIVRMPQKGVFEAIKEIQRVFSKIQKGSFNIPSGKNMNYICKYCHIKEKNLCEGADVQSWRNSYTENFDWKRGK